MTRNTTESVDAFFAAIGEEWRACFDVLLTRDNTPHVKPDPRSLLHFATVRGGLEGARIGGLGSDAQSSGLALAPRGTCMHWNAGNVPRC